MGVLCNPEAWALGCTASHESSGGLAEQALGDHLVSEPRNSRCAMPGGHTCLSREQSPLWAQRVRVHGCTAGQQWLCLPHAAPHTNHARPGA